MEEKDKDFKNILRPLTVSELHMLAIELCNFFTTSNYVKYCNEFPINTNEKKYRALSINSFLCYMYKYKKFNAFCLEKHIVTLMNKLEEHALIHRLGYSSSPLYVCYETVIEMTKAQTNNIFWLGTALGNGFLREKYAPYIIRFEGEDRNGKSGTGSGILIDKNIILTCKHNLVDLVTFTCWIGDRKIIVDSNKYHQIHDIGIVKTKDIFNYEYFPYFGMPYNLDTTITMGYPPLRGMREAALISQTGEINAIAQDWQGCECITISSIVRPGNSGGPVISKSGYIVGIVTQSANSVSTFSVNMNNIIEDNAIPFYNAISSNEIVKILEELNENITIVFEDYQ